MDSINKITYSVLNNNSHLRLCKTSSLSNKNKSLSSSNISQHHYNCGIHAIDEKVLQGKMITQQSTNTKEVEFLIWLFEPWRSSLYPLSSDNHAIYLLPLYELAVLFLSSRACYLLLVFGDRFLHLTDDGLPIVRIDYVFSESNNDLTHKKWNASMCLPSRYTNSPLTDYDWLDGNHQALKKSKWNITLIIDVYYNLIG